MPTISIEWLHLDVQGATCRRCSDTGQEIRQAVARLQSEGAAKGITIIYKERLLPPEQIADSNTILINGLPIDEILPQTTVSASCCPSCGDLTGQAEQCRTIIHLGQEHETIPGELISQAVYKVAGLAEKAADEGED